MQPLPGFRDFYPEDCARRNYILHGWREVARRYGFVEYDGPVLEPVELYKKKSGGELVGQLFEFVNKGGRDVTLRPEMTPTLARLVAARERDFRKPLKWFCVPQFFRYEKQQRGRLREFYQLNCDIIGEASMAADAELIALAIDTLRWFGFTQNEIVVRLSSRDVWISYLRHSMANDPKGYTEPDLQDFLAVADKMEREDEAITNSKLKRFNTSAGELRAWVDSSKQKLFDPGFDPATEGFSRFTAIHELLHDHLKPRGLLPCVDVDFSIVRGLAYYTGVVFEVFDRGRKERALTGGGRYDRLLENMSDGRVILPALGFGMGDVVLANLINETPAAKAKMEAWIAQHHAADLYVVIAKEQRRPDALVLVQQLRDAGYRVDFPLIAAKVGKQFQTAEQLGATRAVLVGDEWPAVKVKTLATREETLIPAEKLAERLAVPAGSK
ncbi:MAG: histidine--tRNA ligase [Verrucomicrobiota bacterium]|nr:histidine--tRNA ligase [Verrucomicrobiota bacterium]